MINARVSHRTILVAIIRTMLRLAILCWVPVCKFSPGDVHHYQSSPCSRKSPPPAKQTYFVYAIIERVNFWQVLSTFLWLCGAGECVGVRWCWPIPCTRDKGLIYSELSPCSQRILALTSKGFRFRSILCKHIWSQSRTPGHFVSVNIAWG